MFKKILIANRGEIAVRISRACVEMGITPVVIYTEPDRAALHVQTSDLAYSLGAEPVAGYLNINKIVELAISLNCDAIHPGYGFLSENPKFAQHCQENNIIFIGPNAKVIEQMGDKTAARNAMKEEGIPIVPGMDHALATIEEALSCAAYLGYPVMLKAIAGGGGHGIRRVDSPEELKYAYERVISEAKKAFGNGSVFLEKYILNPRHLEVQILADKYGNVVHLFERDCSIQRRHQKLIEMAPSPQINETLREKITKYAVRAAKKTHYENAGTVEFLWDGQDNVYFMEMNTRLQVEHGVTEQITGIDIVQAQIEIAAGNPLPFEQKDITKRGVAIEFRINAEDPKNSFLPNFGKIYQYDVPGGPGIRMDSGIYIGYEIAPYYDSMCAKLIVSAFDWKSALARGIRALKELKIDGMNTTIPYYLKILESKDFQNGTFDTDFIANHVELIDYSELNSNSKEMVIIAAAAIASHLGM